jgi:hypothetical protein
VIVIRGESASTSNELLVSAEFSLGRLHRPNGFKKIREKSTQKRNSIGSADHLSQWARQSLLTVPLLMPDGVECRAPLSFGLCPTMAVFFVSVGTFTDTRRNM